MPTESKRFPIIPSAAKPQRKTEFEKRKSWDFSIIFDFQFSISCTKVQKFTRNNIDRYTTGGSNHEVELLRQL